MSPEEFWDGYNALIRVLVKHYLDETSAEKTSTNKDHRETIEKFLEQNLTFSVRSIEKFLGNGNRKLAYYYISKLLKKRMIRKTCKYENQGAGKKPLMLYEVVKQN